ncbi:Gustatory receptor 29 [Frankliniella occidentalis]|nr:Gustatory receptor 29 [Frankliniella occidentalis]
MDVIPRGTKHMKFSHFAYMYQVPHLKYLLLTHRDRLAMLMCSLGPTTFLTLRSNLAWVLVVNSIVLWSGWVTIRDRLRQLEELSADRLDHVADRFVAIISILATFNYVIAPLLWFEMRRSAFTFLQFATPLMRDFGYLVPRCGSRPTILAWLLLVMAVFTTPSLVVVWLFVVGKGRGSNWRHLPAGVYNIVLCFSLTLGLVSYFKRISDFANQMALQLLREIKTGKMRAQRLSEFRASWIDLRRLTQNVCLMPVTTCIYICILVNMSTFFAFQTAVAVRLSSEPDLIFSIVIMMVLWNGSALILCMAAQEVSDVVKMKFDKILRVDFYLIYPIMDSVTQREVKFFAYLTSRSDVRVSVGGFFFLRKETITSIISATVSNVIVLIQFQRSNKFY